ncbi:MAG: BMP family ABC transporter substrate-binding protein [Anaerolineae bacterium]|nr:BMP family ABC transporter substrate-binding protein [Anaerolineae bacterium]MDH7472521.1 BMP family ABC transporter substrate-binding protein [Anaerolineae bacterium]
MRKWIFVTMAMLMLASLLTACPQPATPTTAPTAAPTTPPAKKFRVGMVSDVGGIDDASFNQNTWEGVLMAIDQLGIDGKFLESQAQADYENNITEFAEQGYDLIITVGFLLGDATYKMAKQYPNVKFAIVDYPSGGEETPNLQGILFNVNEASFPVGYLAAAMADQLDPADPVVAYIGGMQIPPVEEFIVAYENGVKYYNEKYGKNVKFTGVYVGDFEAPDQGKIQANSLIDEGADVIMGVGGKTGNGGLAAAKERGKLGVGVDVDQYYTLPNEKDILITSTVKRLDKAVFNVIKNAMEGNFGGGTNYVATLANEGVGVGPFHDFEDKIPENIKADLVQIQQDIIAGKLWTGWGEKPSGVKPGVGFRVGMVSDVGGIDDASFNQNTWEGVLMAIDQLGIDGKFLESQAQADYENNITEFAEQGYDLIITVGFLLGDATAKMAAQYPDTKFAIVDVTYDPPIPNVQGIYFQVDQAAFPVGYLAAAMADLADPADPQVGYVGGMQIPPVEQFIVAYEAGVKYYNEKYGKNVKFTGVYVGDFEAPDQGKIQGNSLIDEGVDVILGCGGKTGNGGLAAAKERGKLGIGVDVDQYYTLPNEKDILVTSTMKRLDKAIFNVIKNAVEGNFGGGTNYVATLANEGVGVAPFHDFEDKVPENIKADLLQIQQDIIAGKLSTGWPRE